MNTLISTPHSEMDFTIIIRSEGTFAGHALYRAYRQTPQGLEPEYIGGQSVAECETKIRQQYRTARSLTIESETTHAD